MKRTRYILRNEDIRARAARIVGAWKIDPDHPFAVTIAPFELGLTDLQREKAWAMINDIAAYHADENGDPHHAQWWKAKLMCEWGWVAEYVSMTIGGVVVDMPQAKSLARNPPSGYRMKKVDLIDFITELDVFMAENAIPSSELEP